jgi:hypothetical protein
VQLHRCEPCQFTFEEIEGEGTACRQCGGPTVAFRLGQAAEAQPGRTTPDSSRTQKLPVLRPPAPSDE